MTRSKLTMLTLAAATALGGTVAFAQTASPVPPAATAPAATAPAGTPDPAVTMPAPGGAMPAGTEGEMPGAHGKPDHKGDKMHGKDGKKHKKGKHHGGMPPGMAQRFDANGDGEVTREEAEAGIAALVTQFDADKDGALQMPEYEALQTELFRPMTERAFKRMDTNGDGKIDQSESTAAAARMNADGPRGPRPGDAPPPHAPGAAPASGADAAPGAAPASGAASAPNAAPASGAAPAPGAAPASGAATAPDAARASGAAPAPVPAN